MTSSPEQSARFARLSRRRLLRTAAVAVPGLVLYRALGRVALAETVSSRWDTILKAAVNSAGWVDYEALKGRLAGELARVMDELGSAVDRFASRSEAKAFWINAYNALCVQTLIDVGLPAEVPHAKLIGANIFTEKRRRIAGQIRSLDQIEHEILRKGYRDPRVHAAVVCGASSCPRLRPEAFVGTALDRQLDEECVSWIQRERTKAGERKNYLDGGKKTFFASKIFDWYSEDFGGRAGILRFLARYARSEDRKLLEQGSIDLEFLPYSWRLNSR